MSNINKEKIDIIAQKGSILVTANPGTGKTRLLAHKYISLIEEKVPSEKILCLTFTRKAKKEMEDRIIQLITKDKLDVDMSKMNIYTFHAYALEHLEDRDIISSNLLRFAIYRYLKDNEILNYPDSYLIEHIVPKMENLIRYIKSFGITYDQIELEKVQVMLEEKEDKYTKEEIDKFAEYFVKIFEYYEEIKKLKGADYTDFLIQFLALTDTTKFDYVLVDELQDVNKMEADIALRSGKEFFAVGDKKQAIFGFQGGSILNFKRFEPSKQFVLSENFRSTNEILRFAREYFVSKTKEESHKKDLAKLENKSAGKGEKPVIYAFEKERGEKDKITLAVCKLVQKLAKEEKEIAVIARTNGQIMKIAEHLKDYNIKFSTTFFSASDEAMRNIITFLKGIISNDFNDVKNAMFTPFFPESLQKAFEIADDPVFEKIKDSQIKLEEFYKRCPAFYKLRQTVKNVEDVNLLFLERIMPIAIAYGKEYLFAVAAIQKSYQEALNVIEDKTMNNLIAYMESSDLLADESDTKSQITLTTVHKAKGKEFDVVVYTPTITRDKSNFQDDVVEAILKTKGVNAEEELEEETLRVNFVAFTRAKKKLYILTDKPMDYYNEYSVKDTFEVGDADAYAFSESKKRAYNLFVNGKFEEAKDLLTTKKTWLKDFVKDHFRTLDSISFTSISEDAYDYFVKKILKISEYSFAMGQGSEVHKIAEKICKKEGYGMVPDKIKPFEENVKRMVQEIEANYPKCVDAENRFSIPLSKLLGTAETLNFTGKIDAIFKNGGKYLIIDWKTDRKDKKGSEHRQQLEVYKRAFSILEGVPLDDIRVAIGFVGLRSNINTGYITSKLDMLQPQARTFETFSKKVHNLLSWKNNVDAFFENLIEQKKYANEVLWRSIVEQYNTET